MAAQFSVSASITDVLMVIDNLIRSCCFKSETARSEKDPLLAFDRSELLWQFASCGRAKLSMADKCDTGYYEFRATSWAENCHIDTHCNSRSRYHMTPGNVEQCTGKGVNHSPAINEDPYYGIYFSRQARYGKLSGLWLIVSIELSERMEMELGVMKHDTNATPHSGT